MKTARFMLAGVPNQARSLSLPVSEEPPGLPLLYVDVSPWHGNKC